MASRKINEKVDTSVASWSWGSRFEVALKLVNRCKRASEAAEERRRRDTVIEKGSGK